MEDQEHRAIAGLCEQIRDALEATDRLGDMVSSAHLGMVLDRLEARLLQEGDA